MKRTFVGCLPVLFAISACGSTAENSRDSSPPPESAIRLSEYMLDGQPIRLKGVYGDSSGLTYCSPRKSLFLVLNGNGDILELNLQGVVQRIIKTKGLDDIEGIAYVEGDRFVVAEERRGRLTEIRIGDETGEFTVAQAKPHVIDGGGFGNNGLEGVAWDAAGKRFFMVKEYHPRRIYEIPGRVLDAPKGEKAEFKMPWDFEKNNFNLTDLSDIHVDRRSGHLLILSHESKAVVESTVEGVEVARLSLARGSAGLNADIPQAEGIALDDDGNLYIVSEPNIFYIFKKKYKTPAPQ